MAEAAENVPATAENTEAKKAPDAEGEEIVEGEEGAEATPKKKSKLKLILLITVPVLVLLIGGGIAAYFIFSSDTPEVPAGEAGAQTEGAADNTAKPAKTAEEAATDARPENTYFHALPEMMVNLNSKDNRVSYLKFQASLEIDDQKAVDQLNKVMPRILDTIQVYVRELTVEDLKSSLGIEKLRQELLKRIALIAKDVKIYDILFPEMLTQ